MQFIAKTHSNSSLGENIYSKTIIVLYIMTYNVLVAIIEIKSTLKLRGKINLNEILKNYQKKMRWFGVKDTVLNESYREIPN